MAADPVIDDARYLLTVLRRVDRALVSRRDLLVASSRARFPRAGDLDPALRVLEDHGHLTRLPEPKPEGRGRPPSPTWAVHRTVLAAETEDTVTEDAEAVA